MKTIGMLGGMSWESTAHYYRLINEGVKQRLGGLHSARIVLVSVDFQEVETLQVAGKWEEAGQVLAREAGRVESAGADFLIICTNTMHKVAPEIQAAIQIPILHIADATAEAIKAIGLHKVGLLGTAFTMEQGFYKGRLEEKHNLHVIVPDAPGRERVHRIIYDELCLGIVQKGSRKAYMRVMAQMEAAGAEGIIAGCTEITMLVQQQHTPLPLFDTTALHARAAVDFALA